MADNVKVKIIGEDQLTPVLQKVAGSLATVQTGAGRYVDAAGRMREANGRFVSAATLAAEAAGHMAKTGAKVPPELDKIGSASKSAGGALGGMKDQIFAVAAGMGIQTGVAAFVGGLKNAIVSSFNLAASLEQATLAFTTMLGSGEAAREMLNGLRDFANTTPFEFNELQEATKKMLAYGFEAHAVIPTLRAVGDATAALGGGSEMIGRITVALGQMKAKAKISGEELRQLAESGVPALRYLAEGMGVSTAALQKMLEKGLIPANKGIDLLLAGMTKDFGGMMAKQAETATGKISTLTDSVKLLKTNMGLLVLESAKTVVTSATTFVDAINKKLGSYVNLQQAVDILNQAQKDGLITGKEFAKVGGIDPNSLTLLETMSQEVRDLMTAHIDYGQVIMGNAGYDPVFGADKLSNVEVLRRAIELIAEVEAKREAQAAIDAADEKKRFDISHEGFLKKIKDRNDLVTSEGHLAEVQAAADAAAIVRAEEYAGWLTITTGLQSNFNKRLEDNAKSQGDVSTELAKAEKKLAQMGGGYATVTGKIAATRTELLAIIDAQYSGGTASSFQLASLGSLDEAHRVHLGTLNTLQAKMASGQVLTAADIQAKIDAGKALADLMPALTEQSSWETDEIARKGKLNDASAALESQYGKLMQATIDSGETTDAQKEKLLELRKEIDDNNASLKDNGAAAERAKAETDKLTDGYGDTQKKLDDLIKSQGGNVTATQQQKEEVEKLRIKLQELEDAERNLSKVAAEEALLRILTKKLELAAATVAAGDTEAFSLRERDDMELWMQGAGLKGNKNAEEQLRARVEAQLTQTANDTFTKEYGENSIENGVAWANFAKGVSDKTKELIVTSYDEWIKNNALAQTAVGTLRATWDGIQSKTVEITIRTIHETIAANAASPGSVFGDQGSGHAPNVEMETGGAQVAGGSRAATNKTGSQAGTYGPGSGNPGNATGGSFTGRNPFVVGENGPELFVPQGMAGNIYSNHSMQGVGGNGGNRAADMNITNLNVYGVQNISSLMAALQKEARARGKNFNLN